MPGFPESRSLTCFPGTGHFFDSYEMIYRSSAMSKISFSVFFQPMQASVMLLP